MSGRRVGGISKFVDSKRGKADVPTTSHDLRYFYENNHKIRFNNTNYFTMARIRTFIFIKHCIYTFYLMTYYILKDSKPLPEKAYMFIGGVVTT